MTQLLLSGTTQLDITLEELQRRSNNSIQAAHEECLRLVRPEIESLKTSHRWVDKNGKTLLVYLSHHTLENGDQLNDGIHVSELLLFCVYMSSSSDQAGARNKFEANMHHLFSGGKYGIKKGQDPSRHPNDANAYLEYKVEGEEKTRFLFKQLAHHFELWGEQGHPEVSAI